jgi:thiamine biosynthesis lipoprotein
VKSAVVASLEQELDRIDRVYSPYRPDSAITRLARGRHRFEECSEEVRGVVELCSRAARLTDGYFDAWHSGRLDPTGLVKGWAVARVADLLRDAGSTRHAVNGGGDVLVVADPASDDPWRVGLSAGAGQGLVGTITAHNLAVATSGNVERPGEIVDPFTGRAAMSLDTVTVVGPDITMADAFATAAVAMGRSALDWATGLPGYAALLVGAHGEVAATPALQSALTRAGRVPPAAR